MKLRPAIALLLFVLGGAAGLVGDHCHVITGTIAYLPSSHTVPFVWSSPLWFPLMVGLAAVALAEFRLHLPAPRTDVTVRQGVAGIAALLGIYVITALLHTASAFAVTVLIAALTVLTYCTLGDRAASVGAAVVAVGGPAVEAAIAATGRFRYAADSDSLFGVPPWLPILYVAFGIVAALLGEIAQGLSAHRAERAEKATQSR
ncbi:MAG TPA: hypothetical protein VFQ37_10135 [Mycobacterium sp.]|nr:hypothetical protein [Mycobacterium sp.]